MHSDTQLAAFVLAQIEWRIEKIAKRQHELARHETLLQERATRLRLGASHAELNVTARQARAASRLPFLTKVRRAAA